MGQESDNLKEAWEKDTPIEVDRSDPEGERAAAEKWLAENLPEGWDMYEPVPYQAMTKKLYETTDAFVWAEEFCKLFSVYTPEGVIEDAQGLMIGWFANAIETAKMHSRIDQEQVGWIDEYGQLYSLALRSGDVDTDRPIYIVK